MNVKEPSLTPLELSENPELAVLKVLATSLEVADMALAATYPVSCEPSYFERCRSEQEAYALSIIYQIDALRAVVGEYAESIRRSRKWRGREPPADDTEF